MVKHDSIVEKSQLGVWKVQVVAGFLGEFFPVANCVVRDVADCSSNKPEVAAGNSFAFNELCDGVQRVAGFFSDGFSGLLVADFCVAVFYFNG